MSLPMRSTVAKMLLWSVLIRLTCRGRHAVRSASAGSLECQQSRRGAHPAAAGEGGPCHSPTPWPLQTAIEALHSSHHEVCSATNTAASGGPCRDCEGPPPIFLSCQLMFTPPLYASRSLLAARSRCCLATGLRVPKARPPPAAAPRRLTSAERPSKPYAWAHLHGRAATPGLPGVKATTTTPGSAC